MSDAMKMVGWIKLAMNKIEKQIDCVLVLENADMKFTDMQKRLRKLEELLNQTSASTVNRSKDLRNRLVSIEGLLKTDRDTEDFGEFGGGRPVTGPSLSAPGYLFGNGNGAKSKGRS